MKAVTHRERGGVSLVSWGQDRGVCLSAHFLMEGEKQSVRADRLVFCVHTDKYMHIYGCEISKQALSGV